MRVPFRTILYTVHKFGDLMLCTSCIGIVIVVGVFMGVFFFQDPDRFYNYIWIARARGDHGGERGRVDKLRARERRLEGMDLLHRFIHRVRDLLSSLRSIISGGGS